MKERINVDHAFDPEARQAQAEFDAYIDSRPYQDEKGNVHNPENGQFANMESYSDETRENHYDQTLAESDYSGESLEQLAKRVATARAEGDRTRAEDAENAFYEKFTAYSEKYGWDKEEAGRSNIDDRLDRYSKIMYGQAEADDAEVDTADTEDTSSAEADNAVGQSMEKTEAENSSKEVKRADEVQYQGKDWKVDRVLVDADTGERMLHLVHTDEKGHIEHLTVTEADAGLVTEAPETELPLEVDTSWVDKEVNEPIDVNTDWAEGLDADEINIDTDWVDQGADDQIDIDTDWASDENHEANDDLDVDTSWAGQDESKPLSRWERIKFTAQLYQDRLRSYFESRRGPEKTTTAKVLGAAAIVGFTIGGAYLMSRGQDVSGIDMPRGASGVDLGSDLGLSGEGEPARELPMPTETEPVDGSSQDELPVNEETLDLEAAERVDAGEGWNQTMTELGIPENEWRELLVKVGPELGEMTFPDQPDLKVAYFETAGGVNEWRINMPESGKMPQEALDLILKARNR